MCPGVGCQEEVRANGSFIRKGKKKKKEMNKPQHRTSRTFESDHAALFILKRRPDATRMILNDYLPQPTDYKVAHG